MVRFNLDPGTYEVTILIVQSPFTTIPAAPQLSSSINIDIEPLPRRVFPPLKPVKNSLHTLLPPKEELKQQLKARRLLEDTIKTIAKNSRKVEN